jgi:hypothetical protein
VDIDVRNSRLTRVGKIAVAETIQVEVPENGVGDDVAAALAAHGLHAEIVGGGESRALRISFADDERERLVAGAIHALEAYLSDRMLPLVVQRSDGGAVVRPPAE